MAKTAQRKAISIPMDANTAALDAVIRADLTFTKKVLSSEQAAKDFLSRTGIYTKTGRLSRKYK